MTILAIATSGPHGGIALQPEGHPACHVPLAAGAGRGRDVLPALQTLLGKAHLGVRDIERIIVDVGPGSFTGVRVGVTLAKTLAWALELPVLAVSSLELLASQAASAAVVLSVRDAGRGTVYHRRTAPGEDAELGRSAGAALRAVAEGIVVVGEEAGALSERFGWHCEARDVAPGAEALLALAREERVGTAVAAHDLAPLYLQASAPERKAAGELP